MPPRCGQGWADVPAIARGHVWEIKSSYILQPGPAALTEGVRQIHALLARSVNVEVPEAIRPVEALDA